MDKTGAVGKVDEVDDTRLMDHEVDRGGLLEACNRRRDGVIGTRQMTSAEGPQGNDERDY